MDTASLATIISGSMTASAAIFVGFLSFIGLCIGFYLSKKSEYRIAYRKVIEEKYSNVGSLLYQIVAISKVIISKYQQNQSVTEKIKLCDKLKSDLDKYRLLVRYSLWGLDEALNMMKKLPSYALRCNSRIEIGYKLIESATEVRKALDDAIMNSYLHGKNPSSKAVRRVNRCAKKLDDIYAVIYKPK
jgi:hypothetical protein